MKRKLPAALVLLISLEIPSAVLAGNFPNGILFVADSSQDFVMRLEDVDGSGAIEPDVEGEIRLFYDSSSPESDLSVPSGLAAGPNDNLYLLDGGTLDTIFSLRDENGDGDANEVGEARVFFDNSVGDPGLTLGTPNTLLALPDGSFLVSDDGSGKRRILRLEDLNGDRDALDDEEASVVYDSGSQSEPIIEDPESLAWSADGCLFVGDSTLEAVFKLVDLDDNGDYLGPGEVNLFFQGNGIFPLTDIDALAIGEDQSVYVANEDTGLVVRLIDRDGDGNANAEGEATIFIDPAGEHGISDLNDMKMLPGDQLLIIDGSEDSIFVATDLDGNGDAAGDGEVCRVLLDGGDTFGTPSAVSCLLTDPPPEREFLRGDSDRSLDLDVSDAVAALVYLFQSAEPRPCPDAMDANDSGEIDVSDPIYTLNHLFLDGPPPPSPFPDVGPDPTQDSLGCL